MRISRRRRRGLVLIAIALLSVLSGALMTHAGTLDQTVQPAIYDTLMGIAPNQPGNQTTIVAIDDKTIAKYGRWPLPRRAYTELLNALRPLRPSVVAFDVGFYDPSDQPAQDAALAIAIRASGNVILAMQGVDSEVGMSGALRYQELKFPIASLREAAAGLGSVSTLADGDGKLRSQPLVITDGTDRYYALGLVAAMHHKHADLSRATSTDTELRVPAPDGTRVIQVGPSGSMYIYFTASPATPPSEQTTPCSRAGETCVVSLVDVVNGAIPATLLSGRIVLVGAHSASALPDSYPVPTSGSAKMYGVEIWADVALTILRQTYPLLREAELPTLLWLLLMTVVGIALTVRFRLLGFVGALVALLLYILGNALLYNVNLQGGGRAATPSFAYVALIAPFWWVIVLGVLLVEESGSVKRAQHAFGLAVTPEIAKHIMGLEDEGNLRLGGQIREGVTVLFGDIRGFTTLGEGMDPSTLMATLNRYFEGMVQIVQRYGGTVNKYNGDNLMVIWGAPLATEGSALHAVSCALRLQQFVVAERAKGGPDVSFGFGINSGPVVAGLLGAQGRFEYTVIGDTVNVASRLTSSDISRRDQVAISEETRKMLPPDVDLLDLGYVSVKGRTAQVHCYQVNRLAAIASPAPAGAVDLSQRRRTGDLQAPAAPES